MVPTCRHIMPSNIRCDSPAIHDQHYCYHHRQVKILTRRPPRRRHDCTHIIPFVFAEDRAAIQINLHLVNQALMEGRIDTRTANAYTANIRIAAINLRQGPLTASLTTTLATPGAENASVPNPNLANIVQRVILTPDGDEIAPPREVLEPGEQSPLHHAGCPCRRCAEQFRNAPPEQHHPDCQCGLCEDSPSLPNEETAGAPSLEPEATRACPEPAEGVGGDEPSPSDQSASASSVVKNNSAPTTNNWGLTTDNCELTKTAPATNLGAPSLEPEATRVGSHAHSVTRTAPATKLYDQEPTKDPVNQPFNLFDYLHGDAHKKHEAQYAARARAAIEAGLEPPPYEPFDPTKVESEDDRRYREDREQIERNREAARLAWNKLHPDEPVEYTPYLTWGEQHDLKLAQAKKQKEEEEARAREQS